MKVPTQIRWTSEDNSVGLCIFLKIAIMNFNQL